MDLDSARPDQLRAAASTFSGPLTARITDYLRGFQLGPRQDMQILGADGKPLATIPQEAIGYWAGDLLPSTDPRFPRQVEALRKSFTYHNLTLQGVELLADGIGADEPDWAWVPDRPLKDGEKPTAQEQALINELDSVINAWWDARRIPDLLQQVLVPGIAHGRQPIRPRIPDRYRDPATGRLKVAPLARSLDGFYLTLPDVQDSGLYTDPDTLETVGLTVLRLPDPQNRGVTREAYEITDLDEQGRTRISRIEQGKEVATGTPLDLGGQLWLFELRFQRPAVTGDVLANQDALNVALTSLSRNTRWAAFEKTLMIGIDPPVDDEGKLKPLSGPGAESYLQPAVMTEVEQGTDTRGQPTSVTRERMYPGASVTKLDPSEPKAIQAAIDQATANIYSILRQRFMLMDDKATASGRSREVATGAYLRACARYSTAVEGLIRDILTLAARISAITQGKPGRYDRLRPIVTCRQRMFEPSAEVVTVYQALQTGGVISMQTLRGMVGVADPDAEQQQIDKERGAQPAPDPTPQPPPDPAPPA